MFHHVLFQALVPPLHKERHVIRTRKLITDTAVQNLNEIAVSENVTCAGVLRVLQLLADLQLLQR